MVAGIFDEFFGVPTHPLAVHAPIVLIPIVAVASVVVLVRPAWRRRAAVPLAALAFVMVALLFVAKESGEALEESGNVLGDVERHTQLAEQTFLLSIAWFVLAAVAAVVVRMVPRRSEPSGVDETGGNGNRLIVVTSALATVAVIVTTVWLVRTGHAGAESRWVG